LSCSLDKSIEICDRLHAIESLVCELGELMTQLAQSGLDSVDLLDRMRRSLQLGVELLPRLDELN
jgi:hypothetical protein